MDHRHPYGVVRREFLQVGFSGFLGLGTAGLLSGRAQAKAATPAAKSMILVFLTGGLGHLDSFDMKPDAPEGILLTVTESGFSRIPLARRVEAFTANAGGWPLVVKLVEKYLAQNP